MAVAFLGLVAAKALALPTTDVVTPLIPYSKDSTSLFNHLCRKLQAFPRLLHVGDPGQSGGYSLSIITPMAFLTNRDPFTLEIDPSSVLQNPLHDSTFFRDDGKVFNDLGSLGS
ncbi:hypothetical protein C8J56DRAFT_1067289 [Mycena floridula]|nr:hypothetical protein C8J56DRAFT_1067289 [Mycena floridula]